MANRAITWIFIGMLWLTTTPTLAAVKDWNDGTGNWSSAASWTPAGVPGGGDAVNIVFSDDVLRTVTYDYAGSAVALNTLNVDMTGAGTNATTLSMGAGALTTSGDQLVGVAGRGTLNQSGGINTANALTIGSESAALGTYSLSAGTLNVNGSETIGATATGNGPQSGGTFTQTGGVHKVSTLTLAANPGSTGTFSLSTGSLVSSSGEFIGNLGTGTLTQTSGVHTSTADINIGAMAGSTGTYTLSGGAANAANIFVGGRSTGAGGAGVMTVSGTSTSLNVPGTVSIYNTSGTAFNLQGGTLNAGAINVNGVPALFNWTAGTLNITNDVTWDVGAANTSTSAMFGASLSLGTNKILKVTGNETIGGNGSFGLSVGSGFHQVTGNITLKPGGSISGSSFTPNISYSTFTQAGGAITGGFRNTTNFIYQSGTISAQFVNDGTFTFGPSVTISSTFTNNGTMTVAGNQSFTASSPINAGSFTVAGGTVGGSFTNVAGATLTAHGTFTSNLTNHGTLIVDGALSLAQGSTNDGVIQGNGSISGTITNSAGGAINSTTPGGGLTVFSLTNSVGGIVNVGPTSTLSVGNFSNWTNSGVINLQGAGARLMSTTLTNNGTIQGFGTVSSSISTSSTGLIRASGGELVFTASGISNQSSSTQIQIMPGSTLSFLQGLASNSGTMSIVGGTFDNYGKTLSQNGTINGYGILRTGSLNISSGMLSVGEGDMHVHGTVNNNGTVNIQSGRTAYFYNTVSGSGSFTGPGTAVFLANLSPGNSPGLVSFAGGASLGGAMLTMELGGTSAGNTYDKIDVDGQLSIGGLLRITLINEFAPTAGNAFDLLDWGTLSGTFSSLQLPSLDGALAWDTTQLYTSGTISVISAGLAGDYNNNGAVDAADYVVWRKDPDRTQAGYDLWREHFGQTLGSGSTLGDNSVTSATVPEPASLAFIVAPLIATIPCRRRGSRPL